MKIRDLVVTATLVTSFLVATVNAQSERLVTLTGGDGEFLTGDENEMGTLKGLGGPCGTSNLYFGAEMALLEPHVGALSVTDGTGTLQLSPDFDAAVSPRFWVGYDNPEGLGTRLTYWQFDQDTTTLVDGATVAIGLEARTLDFDIYQKAVLCGVELQFTGGLRYARMVNDLALSIPGEFEGAVGVEFEGLGPTVALDFRRPLTCRPQWSLIGGLRGSWLYGDTTADFSDTDTALALEAEEHMMQVWNTRMGLEWSRSGERARFFAQALLEAQAWEWAPVATILHQDIGFIGPTFAIGLVR